MKENPDWCFCGELLDEEPDIDYKNNIPIGKTDPIDGWPYPETEGYTQDIYKCNRCGKKTIISIGI